MPQAVIYFFFIQSKFKLRKIVKEKLKVPAGCILSVWTVPMGCILSVGIVPTRCILSIGTVPTDTISLNGKQSEMHFLSYLFYSRIIGYFKMEKLEDIFKKIHSDILEEYFPIVSIENIRVNHQYLMSTQ